MATDRRIGRVEAAAIEPKPPVGGATFAGDGATAGWIEAGAPYPYVTWLARCRSRDEADFALLCDVLGIGGV